MTDQPTPARYTADTITDDQLDALYARLDASAEIDRGYCPDCGRGDLAPTAGQWYEQQQRADKAEAQLATFALIFEGFGRLLATSSRDWGAYRVDAWLWAVICGWDCEAAIHDDTCVHGTLQEMAAAYGWSDEAVAKARRYRAAVRALPEPTK